jgi:hypothetical protein
MPNTRSFKPKTEGTKSKGTKSKVDVETLVGNEPVIPNDSEGSPTNVGAMGTETSSETSRFARNDSSYTMGTFSRSNYN